MRAFTPSSAPGSSTGSTVVELRQRLPQGVFERIARIELMVFDVDGVLTDGRLWIGPDGEVMKAFHVLDGAGIKALIDANVAVAVISGRDSPITARRCAELGIEHVMQGVSDKSAALDSLRQTLGKAIDVCGYMGDDEIDVPVMRRVGFSATVPNAADGVADFAHWVSRREGGQGAVREVCDLLLAARVGAERAPITRGTAGALTA